jgi:hypothetical protein
MGTVLHFRTIRLRSRGFTRGNKWVGKQPIKSYSGPTHEPRSLNIELIGCQSVRQWSSFLSLRTVVRAYRSCEPCYHLLLVSETVRCRWCPP